MSDRATGWVCFLLIMLILGDICVRLWTEPDSRPDSAADRTKIFNKAMAAFAGAAFGSPSMNSLPVGATIKDDAIKMEFARYQGDTMLAFATMYRHVLLEPQTNGVERTTAGLMTEIAGIRDEIGRLRKDSMRGPTPAHAILAGPGDAVWLPAKAVGWTQLPATNGWFQPSLNSDLKVEGNP